MTDKAREEFEAAVISNFKEVGLCEADLSRDAKGQYVYDCHNAAWWAWQTSRVAMKEIAEKAYMAGWEESGEGWNAEYPGDAHEKESFTTRRDLALESFGLLKVSP